MQSRIIQDRVAITIETKIYYIIKPYGDPNVVPNHWGPHSHYHSIGNPNAVPNVFQALVQILFLKSKGLGTTC